MTLRSIRSRLGLVVGLAVAACGPVPSPAPDQTGSPSPATSSEASPTAVGAATFQTAVEIVEHCGSIGGCEYEATLTGPGMAWTWVYEWTYPVLWPDDRVPETLEPGPYALSLVVWMVSDVCDPDGCPRLSPLTDCRATFEIGADDLAVEAIGRAEVASCALTVGTGPPSGACRAADLEARIGRIDGAAGSRFATVLVMNQGQTACDLGGPVSLQLTAGDDGDRPATGWQAADGVRLEPDAIAGLDVRVANLGGLWVPPVGLAIVLAGLGGRIEAGPPLGSDGLELIAPPIDPAGPSRLEVVRGWELD
jgi:hypothetical protein